MLIEEYYVVIALFLFLCVLISFSIAVLVIMRGFRNVAALQKENMMFLEREQAVKAKEDEIVRDMLRTEIRGNHSKLEAYLLVYEEMLSEIRNPQRKPKYQKAGDLIQRYPALERAVFEKNNDVLVGMGAQVATEVVELYGKINDTAEYVSIEPDMPIDHVIQLIADCIGDAQGLLENIDGTITVLNKIQI